LWKLPPFFAIIERLGFNGYFFNKMTLGFAEKIRIWLSNVWFLWALCLIFNIITFLFIFFKIHPGDKTLALHYNVLIGVQWYGKGKNLYFIPVAGLAISAVNFILYKTLRDNKIFLSQLTVFVSFCAQIILLAAALFLSKVN
jgi:hypothetical protein